MRRDRTCAWIRPSSSNRFCANSCARSRTSMSLWKRRCNSSTRWPVKRHEPVSMKNFEFPLARVMDWRRTQVQIEEAALERLHAELSGLEIRLAETRAAREQAGKDLLAAGSATGAELCALDHYRRAAAVECAKLGVASAESRKRIALQLQVVIRKRRDVLLLEN